MRQRYYNQRRAAGPRRHARLEFVLSAVVLAAVIATIVVFLVVYHDLPFRLSGGY
jgi:hypothetical protein